MLDMAKKANRASVVPLETNVCLTPVADERQMLMEH